MVMHLFTDLIKQTALRLARGPCLFKGIVLLCVSCSSVKLGYELRKFRLSFAVKLNQAPPLGTVHSHFCIMTTRLS